MHKFRPKEEVRIVKDLSGNEPTVVGCTAQVLALLPTTTKYPQYKVLIFGENKAKGGIFEVDERELSKC
jgi:hypothetical protein